MNQKNDPVNNTPTASPYEALSLAMLAGELLMKNGAETFRVEDTMIRFIHASGYYSDDCYATPTGIIASLYDSEDQVYTSNKRINKLTNNFSILLGVNQLSRSFSKGDYTTQEARQKLLEIQNMSAPYSPMQHAFWCGVACASFSWLLGGAVIDSINAFIVGLIIKIILQKTEFLPGILQSLLGGVLIATFAQILIFIGIGKNVYFVVIGSLMPLLPGITFINAIRDLMAGDFVSGSSRMSDALLLAVCLATGIATTLSFGRFLLSL